MKVPLNKQGCPIDPMDPVPNQWETKPANSSPSRTAAGAMSAAVGGPQQPALVSSSGASVQQIVDMAGFLKRTARNPHFEPYEYENRIGPNQSWFDPLRSPTNPTQFELAVIKPNKDENLIIYDFSIVPWTFSGVAPNGFDPIDDGVISGSLGYVCQIDGRSPGSLTYSLDPLAVNVRQQTVLVQSKGFQQFNAQNAVDAIAMAVARGFGAAAGFGNSMAPQSHRRYGAPNAPFTEFLDEVNMMRFMGVVFNQITIPISFVDIRISGFRCKKQVAQQLITELKNFKQ